MMKKLLKKRIHKKGFTLMELTIAITAVAIVTAMVISFTVLINAQTRKATKMLELQQELEMTELMIRHWISFFDTAEYGYKMEGSTLYAYPLHDPDNPDKQYTVWLEDGKLNASYPDGAPRYTGVAYIDSVSFLMVNEEGWAGAQMDGELIRCQLTYIQPSASDTASPKVVNHVFVVSTRISHT